MAFPRISIMQLPAPAIVFDATAESLLSDTNRIVGVSRELQNDVVAQITPETATFANTILRLAQDENHRLYERQLIEFYGNVSTNKAVRDASREAEQIFSRFDTEIAMRDDLYKLVVTLHERGEKLESESQRLLNRVLGDFKGNGLALGEADRLRLKQVNASLNRLKQQYLSICAQDVQGLWFTEDELEGLEMDIVRQLERGITANAGKLKLTLQGKRYQDALSTIRSQETRRRIYNGYANNCKGNVDILEETVALRLEKAKLLGYANFAELRMARRMERSPAKVQAFLDEFLTRLASVRDARTARWRRLKREDLEARGEYDDGKFYIWDLDYYSQKAYELAHPSDDEDKTKEYFALDGTIDRMLTIFERVMSIDFAEVVPEKDISHSPQRNMLVWHEDVRMFAVWDDSCHDGKRDKFLGYLYMDMYPRPGKIPGFCDLPIRPAFTDNNGRRQHTATCLVCNFDKPTTCKPSLLQHSEVILLFHELGHAIHDLVAETDFARFHGASTAGDFNEAPSQMLEEWCWYPTTLRMLSQHYTSISPMYMHAWRTEGENASHVGSHDLPGELPDDVIENLLQYKRAYNVGKSLVILNMAFFDMAMNSCTSHDAAENLDTTWLYHSTQCKVFALDMPDDLPPMQAASTDHFNVSGMYIYLTSQLYAMDMFHSAFKENPMDRDQGLRYRRAVIGKGSSEDEMKMLNDFLGRPPRSDALYDELGLTVSGL